MMVSLVCKVSVIKATIGMAVFNVAMMTAIIF